MRSCGSMSDGPVRSTRRQIVGIFPRRFTDSTMLPCERARNLKIIDNAKCGTLYHDENASGDIARGVVLAALGASAARADLENENLLVTAPPDTRLAFATTSRTC